MGLCCTTVAPMAAVHRRLPGHPNVTLHVVYVAVVVRHRLFLSPPQVLGGEGRAPASCTPAVLEHILQQHMDSPSMLAIFPMQVGVRVGVRWRGVGTCRPAPLCAVSRGCWSMAAAHLLWHALPN